MIWILIAIVVLGLLYGIGQYNRLVQLRQGTSNAWSQIDVQLKRRYDLIPNLVETVKAYMAHEKDTLERVIQARNQAIAAKGVPERAAAEGVLTTALHGLFALAEAYPELRSNQNMLALQEELRSTENRIAFARQYYNDVVTAYNTATQVFPTSIFASMGGFQRRDLFELDDAAAREPVKVQF